VVTWAGEAHPSSPSPQRDKLTGHHRGPGRHRQGPEQGANGAHADLHAVEANIQAGDVSRALLFANPQRADGFRQLLEEGVHLPPILSAEGIEEARVTHGCSYPRKWHTGQRAKRCRAAGNAWAGWTW
jgi:hypothetical protein